MSHTPGKLELKRTGWDGQLIYGNDERVMGGLRFIAEVSLDYDGSEEANARRLVACWNACDGFETDLLENIVMTGDTIKGRFDLRTKEERAMVAERDYLRAVNAELLEAAKKMDEELRHAWRTGVLPADAISGDAVRAFSKAIASAKNQEVKK